jgi:hypothetical protein
VVQGEEVPAVDGEQVDGRCTQWSLVQLGCIGHEYILGSELRTDTLMVLFGKIVSARAPGDIKSPRCVRSADVLREHNRSHE